MPFTINLNDLDVTDADHTYPDELINVKGTPAGSTYSVKELSGRLAQKGNIEDEKINVNGSKGICMLEIFNTTGTRYSILIFKH